MQRVPRGGTVSRRTVELTATKITRSAGIVAQAGEERVCVPLRRSADTIEAEFLGEGILQSARQPAEGTLIRNLSIELGVFVLINGSIALRQSQTLRRILDAIPQPWLVAILVYRTLGV